MAHDLVGFALGTDSAGSGRIPAAFNNLVGWKPTRGQEVPSPLGPGKIKLKTGEQVTGFLMESSAAASAEDISSLGSWKNVAQ